MKIDEFAKYITDMSNYKDGEDLLLEFPDLCGTSNLGSTKHKHGHLALSVDPDTVKKVAFEESHVMALFVIPRTVMERINNEKDTKQ